MGIGLCSSWASLGGKEEISEDTLLYKATVTGEGVQGGETLEEKLGWNGDRLKVAFTVTEKKNGRKGQKKKRSGGR